MKNLKGVLIDVYNEKAYVATLDDKLDAYYEALGCDTIDIVARKIGIKNKYFNIVCDDEGLFRDYPKISAINDMGGMMLVGNLFVTGGVDDEGNLVSLTDEEAEYVMKHVMNQATRVYSKPYPMLHMCHA